MSGGKRFFLRFLLALALLGAVAVYAYPSVVARLLSPVEPGSTVPVAVEVPAGAGAGQIADLLHGQGLVRHPLLVRAFSRYYGLDSKLKPGRYIFFKGQSLPELMTVLEQGKIDVHRFTIPEGLTVIQVADLLASQGIAPREDLLKAARDPALVSAWLPAGVTLTEPLEGYLFPDTYETYKDTTPADLVKLMVGRLNEVWQPGWNDQAKAMQLTPHQVLTLASIVEKEARVDAERPVIASVYLNRLAIGMKLDADPTVRYALNIPPTQIVLFKDLEVDSPYNTYRRAGLPPGPIAAPGAASIRAVLQPAQTPFLFFVAKEDGSGEHIFSQTYAEHQAAIDRIRGNQ